MSRVVTIPNFEDKSVMTLTRTPAGAAGGGVTAIYELYGYVPL